MLLNPGEYLLQIGIADCRSDYDFTSLDSRNNLTKITVVGKAIAYGLVHTQPHFRLQQVTVPDSLEIVLSHMARALASDVLQPRIARILQITDSLAEPDDIVEREERAWPGEARFVATGYTQRMLGRYAFAGAEYCRGARVLDICCGLGWGAHLVAQYAQHITAFDRDRVALAECQARWHDPNITWRQGDALDFAFLGDDRFDVILAMEALEHFTAPQGAQIIAEAATYLRSGGLFIGTSAFPETVAEAEQLRSTNSFHPHIFTRSELENLLQPLFSEYRVIGGWMFVARKA